MDRDGFDRLLVQHLPSAHRFAIRLTGDVHRAEDLVHDSIVRAVRNCGQFRAESKFTTWFFQIIVNCFRDQLRRRPVEALDNGLAGRRIGDGAASVECKEIGAIVARHVSALPPRQREVLVLIVYEGFGIADVAAVLGISEQNVRTSLSYARQRLRQSLAEYLPEDSNERKT